MKKIILLYLAFSIPLFGQYKRQDIMDKVNLKPVQLPDTIQLKIWVESIKQSYGKAFKFYDEFKSGSYKFIMKDKKTDNYAILIINNGKEIYRINVKQKKDETGKDILIIDKSQIEKLIDESKIQSFGEIRNLPESIIIRNGILHDELILPVDDLDPYEQRLLDRKFMWDNFEDQNGDHSVLYKILQTGNIIPYSGGHSKILTLDNGFHSIIYFDQTMQGDSNESLNKCYGYWGDDPGEFMNPTGMCIGRKFQSRGKDVYNVYIADMYNLRIPNLHYVADLSYQSLGYFDKNFWGSFYPVEYPYDVGYFNCPLDPNQDKIWVSEARPTQPFLCCLNLGGFAAETFIGYRAFGQNYVFEQGTLSRLDVYSDYFYALCFIDNVRNSVVCCKLNDYGLADSTYTTEAGTFIKAQGLEYFPEDYRVNSVHVHKTSEPGSWPYVWVTSGYSPPFTNSLSYFHTFKMNKTPGLHYLASTKLPDNSLEDFSGLMNTMSAKGYYDIYTIEKWSDTRGLRKYYPSADYHSNTLVNYCQDSIDLMKWKAVLTNDCWIKFSAERLSVDGWVPVKFRYVTDAELSEDSLTAIKYQLAGWNQNSPDLYDDVRLDLPLEDYVLGGKVKLIAKIFPEYYYQCRDNQRHAYVEDTASIRKFCLPHPGGCPFIYVLNSDSTYKVDNNILHRWEFDESGNPDIRDLYKLQVEPGIFNNDITISIAENEHDHSYFDLINLYAVDYPEDRILGITESNDIVLYDSTTVISSDTAFLNNSTKIQTLINYNSRVGVKTLNNDTIYAHYPAPQIQLSKEQLIKDRKQEKMNTQDRIDSQSGKDKGETTNNIIILRSFSHGNTAGTEGDSIAIIALIGNLDTLRPVSSKNWGGTLTGVDNNSNNNILQFARRERLSEVIIPFFATSFVTPEYIGHIGLKLHSDCKIKYLSAVNITYSAVNPTWQRLAEATLITLGGTSNIISALQAMDQTYAELTPDSMITLRFETSGNPPKGYKRAYLLETVGHYTVGNSDANKSGVVNNVPLKNQLYNNYPNPFNPKTKIKYDIRKNVSVKLTIYNILGQEVKVLVNEFKKAGSYTTEFDGTNLASGVYFYRIEAGDFIDAKKMVLVK